MCLDKACPGKLCAYVGVGPGLCVPGLCGACVCGVF